MVVVIEIEDRTARKPFLGGWRNVITKAEYHNACTQTRPRRSKVSRDCTSTRDTQTVSVINRYTNVSRDKAVQMTESIARVPNIWDKFVTPRNFVSATERNEAIIVPLVRCKLEECAIKIQKCYRAYRARAITRRLASLIREMTNGTADSYLQGACKLSTGCARQFEMINPRLPRTRADLEMLHNVLDRWRALEIDRVNRTMFRSSKHAAHGLILLKEIELLRSIDEIKTMVKRENEERRNYEFLARSAESVLWMGYKGKAISVDTLRVQRAEECKRLYELLSSDNVVVAERLDLLLTTKRSLKIHSRRPRARELFDLIDQELDLLSRNVDVGMLNQLRNRLGLAFLSFARTFVFRRNECEEDKLQVGAGRVERFCSRCSRFLPFSAFSLDDRRRISSCDDCQYLQPATGPRVVYEPYQQMLRDLRRSEARIRCYSSVAFVIGQKIVYQLVNSVWHGKSGISKCDRLDQLRLVRFRMNTDWSPWNSLVLTKREAALHSTIGSPEDVYGPRLLREFVGKNLQAKLRFESIIKLRKLFAESL